MQEPITIIRKAFFLALQKQTQAESSQDLHRKRSHFWVKSLAKQFRDHYEKDNSVRVFSKDYSKNRKDFLLNELLYDVCVCRVDKVVSKQKKELYYIKDVLWQVESEFAKNSRQALVDFNKLVLGTAKNKLFIGPQVHDTQSFIEVLRSPAAACSGSVYLCLLPHPSDWDPENSFPIHLWSFSTDHWQQYRE